MMSSPAWTLIRVLLVLPVLFSAPSSLNAQEPIADAEMVIRFGEGQFVSEFVNPQPSSAVTGIDKDQNRSRLDWGIPVAGEFRLAFAAPSPGDVVAEGRRVDATFGEVVWLGRLGFSTGVIQGGEGVLGGVDLQVAVQLIRPAVPGPVIVTLPLIIDTFTEQVTPDDLWATGGRVNFPQAFPTIDIMANGTPYKLRVIGFGSIDPGGTVTTVSSLFTETAASADLFASIELACDELELPFPITGIPPCDVDDMFGVSPFWRLQRPPRCPRIRFARHT